MSYRASISERVPAKKIFTDYLRVGSIGALAHALNAEGLKPKTRQLANSQIIQVQVSCYRWGRSRIF